MSVERHGGRVAPGSRPSGSGTPVTVDVSQDRKDRIAWLVLLVGPLIGIGHFMLVYLVVEAGCTGGGEGLRLLDPPVPEVATLAATAVAALACLASARWAHRRWREGGDDEERLHAEPLAFAGYLLSLLFFVTVLFVGVSAPFLEPC